MQSIDLQEIIQFAIEGEEESVAFYSHLVKKVKSQKVIQEIHHLIEMEENHVARLKEINIAAFSQRLPKKTFDLKIDDYRLDKKPTPHMSLEDLLEIAIQREQKSAELYTDLAKLFPHPEKGVFENLAAEESSHRHHFELKLDDIS